MSNVVCRTSRLAEHRIQKTKDEDSNFTNAMNQFKHMVFIYSITWSFWAPASGSCTVVWLLTFARPKLQTNHRKMAKHRCVMACSPRTWLRRHQLQVANEPLPNGPHLCPHHPQQRHDLRVAFLAPDAVLLSRSFLRFRCLGLWRRLSTSSEGPSARAKHGLGSDLLQHYSAINSK